jgi:hypothetical protein
MSPLNCSMLLCCALADARGVLQCPTRPDRLAEYFTAILAIYNPDGCQPYLYERAAA